MRNDEKLKQWKIQIEREQKVRNKRKKKRQKKEKRKIIGN